MPSSLRFATDDDLIRIDPRIEQFFPRKDARGNTIRNWDVQHGNAIREIERRLRLKRAVTSGPFKIGHLGFRSRENLREPAAYLALYYLFVAADTQGDESGFYYRWAQHYLKRGGELLDAEAHALDYDESGDDEIGGNEEQRPFPSRVIRG